MKQVLRSLGYLGLLVGLASFVSAADQTWTGQISDSMCGTSHAKMSLQLLLMMTPDHDPSGSGANDAVQSSAQSRSVIPACAEVARVL